MTPTQGKRHYHWAIYLFDNGHWHKEVIRCHWEEAVSFAKAFGANRYGTRIERIDAPNCKGC